MAFSITNLFTPRAAGASTTTATAGPGSSSAQVRSSSPRVHEASRNGFIAKAEKLISRALNWATPQGLRADAKIQAGRIATDAQVGKLLNAFSLQENGKRIGVQGDREAIIKLMEGLPATMEPMTSRATGGSQPSAGTQAGEEEFKASVERNLKAMPRDKLDALQKGMDDIDLLVPVGSLRKRATVIQTALNNENESRQWSSSHSKAYPKPTAADVFATKGSPLNADVRAYAVHLYCDENFECLDSLKTFAGDEDDAKAIYAKFFTTNAPSEINVNATLVAQMKNDLTQWGSLKTEQQRAVFKAAEAEVQVLIETNIIKPFVADPNKFDR